MTYVAPSPFYRFQGWRFIVLLIIFFVYTAWFVGPGYFGQLAGLPDYSALQERGFYTGAEALAAVNTLTEKGIRTKYLALIFDLPYMILQALVFEAAIAFGILQMRLGARFWQWLFILPIGFLLADIFEDSGLLLLLSTRIALFGSIAGVMTFLKFCFFIPAIFISVGLLIGGGLAMLKRRLRDRP